MRKFLAVIFVFICSFFSTAKSQPTIQQKAIVLKRMIELHHVTPRPVNDQFSKELFESFLAELDKEKIYFTQADISLLSKYKTSLDEELHGKTWAFLNAATGIYKKRLKDVDSIITQIAQKPFDFSLPDKVPAGFDTTIAKNDIELKTRWAKLLKLEVLEALSSTTSVQLSNIGVIKKAEIFSKEPEIRKKIGIRHHQKIEHILNEDVDATCAEAFLSSLSACFDPHTNFFDLSDKKNFQTQLNPEGYYFGFGLTENEKNEVAIKTLMPGSPAWKCGQLNKDDVLIKLQWEGQPPIELYTLSAEDVDEMIRVSKENRITLTVRKPNGVIMPVSLQKEKVENEGQFVKSFILLGKQKIGYIYLPGFYTNWEDDGGSSCAEDMAKEIIKLKKDGIEGIILDVRFNGGGSLQEAIELSGIFIDEGPLCLIKSKNGKTVTLKDVNRGTIWDGPLLMLVNGQSASASEMVAAVLQDYNRAIIVGSNTYGKGTAQEIIPIDTTRSAGYAQSSEYGYVKVTDGRIYRVTGQSVQAKGVAPHITLPDGYNKEEWHEAHSPFHLKPDTTKGNNYYRPLPAISYVAVKQLSAARVAANNKFQQLNDWQKEAIENKYAEPLSLKWEDVEKHMLAEYKAGKQTATFLEDSTNVFRVDNHSSDKQKGMTATSGEWNKRWFSRLARDLYVEESYLILSDFIQTIKK